MTLDTVITGLIYVSFGLFAAELVLMARDYPRAAGALNMAGEAVNAVIIVCLVLNREWGYAAVFIALMIFRWWRDWRKRRAGQQLGAKSKALRDSLVRRVRESMRPSPVRVPVPVREGS